MIDVRSGFHLGCTFLDLFFDKIAVIVGLFDVFGVVGFWVFMLSPVWLEMYLAKTERMQTCSSAVASCEIPRE